VSFPVLFDASGSFFEVWDPAGVLPVSYMIDPQGVVAWADAGGAANLDEIEAEVVRLLDLD
jgi:hypothetical protein